MYIRIICRLLLLRSIKPFFRNRKIVLANNKQVNRKRHASLAIFIRSFRDYVPYHGTTRITNPFGINAFVALERSSLCIPISNALFLIFLPSVENFSCHMLSIPRSIKIERASCINGRWGMGADNGPMRPDRNLWETILSSDVQHVTCRAFSGRMGGDTRDSCFIELVDHWLRTPAYRSCTAFSVKNKARLMMLRA